MDSIVALFEILNKITPFAVLAGLIVLVVVFYHPNGPVKTLTDNHLTHMQKSLDKLCDHGEKSLEVLGDIKSDIAYLKGRADRV